MQISAFAPPATASRFFASATALYLGTASWAAGDYTVTFDVTDYVQGEGSAGTVSYAEIGLGEQITGGASISYDFVLTDAGTAGDFLVLGWSTTNPAEGSNGSDSFNIDNAAAVPEPATYALLGGLLALGHVMVRRRR